MGVARKQKFERELVHVICSKRSKKEKTSEKKKILNL